MVSVNGAWMLWTVHSAKITESRRKYYRTGLPKTKPTCIINYNYNMRAVDTNKYDFKFIAVSKKIGKVVQKYFFHLFDLSIYNHSHYL